MPSRSPPAHRRTCTMVMWLSMVNCLHPAMYVICALNISVFFCSILSALRESSALCQLSMMPMRRTPPTRTAPHATSARFTRDRDTSASGHAEKWASGRAAWNRRTHAAREVAPANGTVRTALEAAAALPRHKGATRTHERATSDAWDMVHQITRVLRRAN